MYSIASSNLWSVFFHLEESFQGRIAESKSRVQGRKNLGDITFTREIKMYYKVKFKPNSTYKIGL